MNEFKIHQRYFAKLKQKAHRCKEEAGKENLEPLRTISPDRTLRKRRSTMGGLLSVPSSLEDEGGDGTHQAVESEKELEETLVSISSAVVAAVMDGQTIMSGTYTYDSAQKSFTAHQAKTPFTKKIKISQVEQGQWASEEQRAKDEGSKCGTMNSEEVMEVDNIFSSSSVVDSRNVTDNQKGTKVVTSAEEPSKAVSGNGACVAPETSQLMGSKAATGQTASAAEAKGPDTKEPSQTQKLVSQSAAAPRPSRAGLPQRGQAGHQPSEKDTRSCQKNVSETRPALLREVSQLLHMSSYVLCPANIGLLSSAINRA